MLLLLCFGYRSYFKTISHYLSKRCYKPEVDLNKNYTINLIFHFLVNGHSCNLLVYVSNKTAYSVNDLFPSKFYSVIIYSCQNLFQNLAGLNPTIFTVNAAH